jgi:hypothetical protein
MANSNKRWVRRTKFDRWYNPTSHEHIQVPADYKITHTHPAFKQKLWREFQRLMRNPAYMGDRYAESFEDPDRHDVMTNTKDQYINALQTLRGLEYYKNPNRNQNTLDRSMMATEDAALLNPIASDVPEMLQHYLPTSKRAAGAASGIATGFTRAKEKRLKNKFAGDEPASRSSAVSALRGLGEGIINARPGGERLSNAYSHFFNAELLRSQGAPESSVNKEVNLGMSLLSNDPQFINDIGKYINKDVRATDYIKGTWGKNEIGKYYTEPVTEEQKDIAKDHGITPRPTIWGMTKGLGRKVLARITGGKTQRQMKKDATKDLQADLAHLTFDPYMAQPEAFRETFTRMTPMAKRAGKSMANYLQQIHPGLAARFDKEITKGFDKSYDALGMPLSADQKMDPYNPAYNTGLPEVEQAQKIMNMPNELKAQINDPKFNPPVGLNYNTKITQGNKYSRPLYNPQRTGGFWTRTPEDQVGPLNPTPQPINKPYPNEYIKNVRKKIGGEKDGDNK